MISPRMEAWISLRGVAFALVLAVTLGLSVSASPALATTDSSVQVRVTTDRRARIIEAGAAARIRVEGVCTHGAEVIEAFVYITQDGHTSSFGFVPLVCDGARHSWIVQVESFDQPFHVGPATASPYALVEDPRTGETADDSPFLRIRLVA